MTSSKEVVDYEEEQRIKTIKCGQILLEKGFTTWFLFFFKLLNNIPFIVEPAHKNLLQTFEDIYSGKIKRGCLGCFPRSGKTTMMIYFMAYAIARRRTCNFIYVSYSAQLSNECRDMFWNIINSKPWQAMYGFTPLTAFEKEESVVDRFWQDMFYSAAGKLNFKVRAHCIHTSTPEQKDGNVLFTTLGAQITGFGFGIDIGDYKNAGFTGCMFGDDLNKPGDIFSSYLRQKTFDYFSNTLITRANNPDAGIFMTQQRLHKQDMIGFILENYANFVYIKQPLIINGVCQAPRKYPPERLAELQIDKCAFQAQYQQEPISDKSVICRQEWFRLYTQRPNELALVDMFMTIDIGSGRDPKNDKTCMCVWGTVSEGLLYLLDILWDDIAIEKLPGIFQAFITKNQCLTCQNKNRIFLSAIYIEENGNIGLMPAIKERLEQTNESAERWTNLMLLQRDKNFTKASRMTASIKFLAGHKVLFPDNDLVDKDVIKKALCECEDFRLDESHAHDDFVDNLMDATLATYGDPGYSKNNTRDLSVYGNVADW